MEHAEIEKIKNEGYQSANDREDETVKHTRSCPTRQAKKLAAETNEKT